MAIGDQIAKLQMGRSWGLPLREGDGEGVRYFLVPFFEIRVCSMSHFSNFLVRSRSHF